LKSGATNLGQTGVAAGALQFGVDPTSRVSGAVVPNPDSHRDGTRVRYVHSNVPPAAGKSGTR
jgi:hypothetical protein